MEYEHRLTCFVDSLGFKHTIDQSLENNQIADALYGIINELQPERLVDKLYGAIPFFDFSQGAKPIPAAEIYMGKQAAELKGSWPLAITQFSDSFVISCSAENSGSCVIFLSAIAFIKVRFFEKLGMLVRGGVSIGKLIHESPGALFGPSMNEAYLLESQHAKHPRVIFSEDAKNHLDSILHGHPILSNIFEHVDKYHSMDLISALDKYFIDEKKKMDFESQLRAIERDIKENSPGCEQKIDYLLERFESNKS